MATHWQHERSHAKTNVKMLENEDLYDVTLSAENEQKQIKCHKFILASRSPVFYAMFCGTLAESKEVICVPDIEPSTLEILIRYLYGGKVEINADTVLSLVYAAKKYDIPRLESKCMSFLIKNIDAENVCTIFDQAILFDDEDLKENSLDFMVKESKSFLKSDAFVQMSKSGLHEMLKLAHYIASGCELYVACKRWASKRCRDAGKEETDKNIRQELGNELIRLISFSPWPPGVNLLSRKPESWVGGQHTEQIMATYWQHERSLAKTNVKMLENEDLYDVTLFAGNEQKQIKCHKFILASRSPVFYAMFCGTLAESKEVICVPDIEPSTLEILIRYLYGGKVEINADTVLSLVYAAKKYDIPRLESKCMSFLIKNIDAENVCTIFDQAILFDDEDLKENSLDFMVKKSKSFLKSDAFVRMSKSGLHEMLKLADYIASGCELYVACKRWASKRCRDAVKEETDEHIRQELGDELISLISFETMTLEDFTDVVASENVLDEDESLSMYCSIVLQENVSRCINKPRVGLYGVTVTNNCLFVRCGQIGGGCGCSVEENGLVFRVSQDCELSAVDMFLPMSEGSVTGVLELLEGTTVIHTQNVMLRYNNGVEHMLVNLDKRIHLHSMNKYFIRKIMKGSNWFCCASYKTIITMKGVTMALKDFTVGKTDTCTNVSHGPFYGFELVIKRKKYL